mgnify:FL=1
MKKTASIFLALSIAIVFSISFQSCKKYEEGPALSLASKKGRVANVWKVDKEYDNGVEETCDASCQTSRSNSSIEYTKDGKVIWTFTGFPAINGVWEFSDDKSEIMVKMEGMTEFSGQKIIKLKSKEMWLGDATTKDQDPQDYVIYVTK